MWSKRIWIVAVVALAACGDAEDVGAPPETAPPAESHESAAPAARAHVAGEEVAPNPRGEDETAAPDVTDDSPAAVAALRDVSTERLVALLAGVTPEALDPHDEALVGHKDAAVRWAAERLR